MATLSLKVGLNSSIDWEDRYTDDFAVAGSQHSRQVRSKRYARFIIIWPGITAAELNTLQATYEAGARDEHTWEYFPESPQVFYTGKFTAKPVAFNNHGGGKYDARIELRGTPD
jgi:hypothetical protein